MWIVRLAIGRPYTFVVVALFMLIFGVWFIINTVTDILPSVDLPVVSVVWTYTGLPADEFAQRITTYSEYGIFDNVDNIERIESQTYDGMAVIRVFFYPEVDIGTAVAQVTSTSQSILRLMPTGVTAPTVVRYSANSVPIIQIALSSETLTEEELYDYANFRIRQDIALIPGVTLPLPYGGKVRQLMVDLNLEALQAKGLSPRLVNEAVNNQSVILPIGDARIGKYDYRLNVNNTPADINSYNDFPIKVIDDVVVYLRDVGFAHDGFLPQTNIVRSKNKHSVLMTLLKHGKKSTLDIINTLREMLPTIQAAAPKGMNIQLLFDQSVFVRNAIKSVLSEGVMAAFLTGMVILIFLGSWRSTTIILVSIPLSILTSIIILSLTGYTINIMTLGGLALAIGILVDDATVTLENIHRNLALGKPLPQAVLEGSAQIAVPAFVSTLCISIVFLPVVLLTGPARFLFIPFALAVVFAIMTSYFLSRTLVPVMIQFILPAELNASHASPSLLDRFHKKFEAGFERFRKRYLRSLYWALTYRGTTCLIFALIFVSALLLSPFIGTNFFPDVDAGQMRLHVKAPSGTRIEVTEETFGEVEAEIENILSKENIKLMIDNIGLPSVAYNLAFGDNANLSSADGEILISLQPTKKKPTSYYMKKLRDHLPHKFPHLTFYFQPADMINQILNFGLPSPIDIRVIGYDSENNLKITEEMIERISHVPGAVDVNLHQIVDAPELFLNVDRTLLANIGLTQNDLVTDYLVSNSSSTIITPNFWLDRKMGIPYLIAVQTPKYRVDSIDALMRMPISSPLTKTAQLLNNLASLERRVSPSVVNHYNIQPVYDIYTNVQGRDLGDVASDIKKIIDEYQPKMAPGNVIKMAGLVESMKQAFTRLGMGFIFAILLVYFIIVINFQSWLDPFIIITAVLGVISGVIWTLYLTNTTVSVPALMGAIMSIGVGTANSILVVTFANQELLTGKNSVQAALSAGAERLRPVLMTASAMIVGMIPMALAIGEGGSQNAPLGTVVIGGLLVATCTTLFFVPVVFSYLRTKPNKYLMAEHKS